MAKKINKKYMAIAILLFGISLTGTAMLFSSSAAPAFVLLDKPYVKLFTQASGGVAADKATQADNLKKWYAHVHGEGSNPSSFVLKNSGLGALLNARGVWVSQYRNGSYVSQANQGPVDPLFTEANDLERNHPQALATFWPGDYLETYNTDGSVKHHYYDPNAAKLLSNINSTATQIVVPISLDKPAGSLNHWPYINSNDSDLDGYSSSTADYVSWVKLDNEIIKIVADPVVSGGNVTLTITRGIWGSIPAAHTLGTKLMSPVYLGTTEMFGNPTVNDASKPLRYVYKFWQPDGYRWLADRILQTLGDGKTVANGGKMVQYNTVWQDVSSCDQYNVGSAYKNPIEVWDDLNNQRMTSDNWGKYQGWKLNGQNNAGGGLRDLVKMADGSSVKFTANSILKTDDFIDNGMNNTTLSCHEKLLSETIDAGSLEGWLKGNPSDSRRSFDNQMAQSFEIQQRDWPAMYWVRYDADYGGPIPNDRPVAYKRYAYGAYLLSYNPNATKPQFGMLWGLSKPEDLYFYDFGAPQMNTTSLNNVRIATNVYKRTFSNGEVYVNSGNIDAIINLPAGKTYYKISKNDETGVDQAPTLVSGSQTIQSKDSLFVLYELSSSALTGDLDNNGVVNIIDLSMLLNSWGTNNTTADLSNDGTVDITDLTLLLANWGAKN